MRNGKIRIKTLNNFFLNRKKKTRVLSNVWTLLIISKMGNRCLTVEEIKGILNISKSHAYNYYRAIKQLLS